MIKKWHLGLYGAGDNGACSCRLNTIVYHGSGFYIDAKENSLSDACSNNYGPNVHPYLYGYRSAAPNANPNSNPHANSNTYPYTHSDAKRSVCPCCRYTK